MLRISLKPFLLLFSLVIAMAHSYHMRLVHQYWESAGRAIAETGIPYIDMGWNYCDYKCINLENLYPGIDFYVVNFGDSSHHPSFSACYGKKSGGSAQIWNKMASNSFYEKYCGEDTEDYLRDNKYEKISEEGVGIGTLITY